MYWFSFFMACGLRGAAGIPQLIRNHQPALWFAGICRAAVHGGVLCILLAGNAGLAAAADATSAPSAPATCLPDGQGFFRARLQGAIDAELEWVNDGTECTGAMRPDGGVRLVFSRATGAEGERLVLLFGIAGLKEGVAGRALPVNVTVIRQGTGQFFGTQGDDKCMIDEIRQQPLTGIPHRNRSYRVFVRGFCTEPARSLGGNGSIMIPRFDFVGRVDFSVEDATEPATSAPTAAIPRSTE